MVVLFYKCVHCVVNAFYFLLFFLQLLLQIGDHLLILLFLWFRCFISISWRRDIWSSFSNLRIPRYFSSLNYLTTPYIRLNNVQIIRQIPLSLFLLLLLHNLNHLIFHNGQDTHPFFQHFFQCFYFKLCLHKRCSLVGRKIKFIHSIC